MRASVHKLDTDAQTQVPTLEWDMCVDVFFLVRPRKDASGTSVGQHNSGESGTLTAVMAVRVSDAGVVRRRLLPGETAEM